jgi:zinc protease
MNSSNILAPISFQKITLDNGLDVVAKRESRLPIVAVNLWYHVGSKNEKPRQKGFAHLFEHLMFEGSEHYPGDFFRSTRRFGASVNGSTSADRTNYFVDLPAAHLESAIAIESDRMGFLIPALTETKLRVQKDVVKNEYRQNYANRPYGQVGRLLAEAIYPPNHPYNWLTIGYMEDVENATLADVTSFFETFYVPANASLSLVGDLDDTAAFQLAERYFGPLRGGSRSLSPVVDRVQLEADRFLIVRDRIELERLYLCWPTTPQFHHDDAPLVLLADILARGRSSRLYRLLVVDKQIAGDVSVSQASRELAGTFAITVELRPGRSIAETREVCLEEIQKIARHGVTEEELDRVKNGRLAGFVFALDNIGGFGGVADRLNAYNIFLNDPGRITLDFERYNAVTADQVRETCCKYIQSKARVDLEVRRASRGKLERPLDRSVAPVSAPPKGYKPPTPVVETLSDGTPVWFLPRTDLPIVAATEARRRGAAFDPPDRGGLTRLTAQMMIEGTKKRSGLEFALAAENLGTSVAASAGWDGFYLGFHCLARHLETSLDLALELGREPVFPEHEWLRVRARAEAALVAERDSAEARAGRALLRAIYPADHPYSTTLEGNLDSVSKLDRIALVNKHALIQSDRERLWIFAGQVDRDRVLNKLESLDRHEENAILPPASVDLAENLARPRRLILLDRPAAAQAVVRIGCAGITHNNEHFYDLMIFNHIFGGDFNSRLNSKLREEKGFTYGVRSRFDTRRGRGPFWIGASIQSDKTAEAIELIVDEIEAILGDRPPTAEEIDTARRSLIEGRARHFESPSDLVSRFASLFIHDLPIDDHSHFGERLEAVTAESIARGAPAALAPDRMVAVVVADADSIARDLDRLGWAPVERPGDDQI